MQAPRRPLKAVVLDVEAYVVKKLILLAVAAMVASLLSAAPAGAQTRFYCEGHEATIVGTSGDDVLIGTRGVDVIVALGGNDTIRARSGDDLICAGSGDDLIWGNNGADLIHGGDGADFIRGNRGKDSIFGGGGADKIRGGKHDDILRGDDGDDELRGGNGLDSLFGDRGVDELFGDFGRDFLLADVGEPADGGEGEDTIVSGGTVREGDPFRHPLPAPAGFAVPSLGAPNTGAPACTQRDLYDHFLNYRPTGTLEDQLLGLLNATRAACGLHALQLDPSISAQAEEWSIEMQADRAAGRSGWFRHSTAHRNLPGASDGENVAWTATQQTSQIHTLLIASGPHLCNLLSPKFDYIGIGAASLEANDGAGIIATFMFTGSGVVDTPFNLRAVASLQSDQSPVNCQFS